MEDSVRAILAGVCTILIGAIILVVMFQVYTSGTYSGASGTADLSSNANVITDSAVRLGSDVGSATDSTRHGIYTGARSVETSGAQTGEFVGRAMLGSAKFVGSTVVDGISLVGRGGDDSLLFVGHALGGGVSFAGRTIGGGIGFVGDIIGDGAGFIGHTIGGASSFAMHATHVSALIKAPDHEPTPIITQLRAQQAAIIQSGTKAVSIASITSGTGGACDAGAGNGGYPMAWCNAAMDTIATVPYSSDTINRECTSYAYWYFTSIEGHAGFKAWGNAKDWAATSNYPTHALPAVGAIAVETVGAYGHVAIVQALPGQKYADEIVPAGYVLVSEMNYDWAGHFRYSYSPISKFSAYIYP